MFVNLRVVDGSISIHALLAESDTTDMRQRQIQLGISIHALLAESDCNTHIEHLLIIYFYPRSPCGERRQKHINSRADNVNFYPRSPCGERRTASRITKQHFKFLSTLSLRRATFKNHIFFRHHNLFLSTLSLRRATRSSGTFERDQLHFYPRSPCGERRRRSVKLFRQNYISIHALLAESDLKTPCVRLSIDVFLSTLSLRRATITEGSICFDSNEFLSTLSLRRATESQPPCGHPTTYFYPRSPCGERR